MISKIFPTSKNAESIINEEKVMARITAWDLLRQNKEFKYADMFREELKRGLGVLLSNDKKGNIVVDLDSWWNLYYDKEPRKEYSERVYGSYLLE